MEATLTQPNSKSSYKFAKSISIFVIAFVSFALLFGTAFVKNNLLSLISTEMVQIPRIQLSIPKNTFFEIIIALLNILLATFVLFDSRFIRPIDYVADNSPTSDSFKQLVFGWRMLWFGWILLYTTLAIGWLGYDSWFLSLVSNVFNVMNGFFFYYLFFVLDTYSVKTESETKRDKGFKLNILITFFVGVLVLVLTTFVSWEFKSDESNNFFVNNLIAAYTAVGMVFFFGRLDSHYLNISRIVLAPLYLYAVIQLFWVSDIFNTKEPSANRIVIFTVALILKTVIFYLVSKEIREGVFYSYMIDAVKGIEKKRKLALALSEVKENESILEISIYPKNNLETILIRLNALNSVYNKLCQLLGIPISDYPLKVIMFESGSIWAKIFGESKAIALVDDGLREFGRLMKEGSKQIIYYKVFADGKREKERIEREKVRIEIEKKAEFVSTMYKKLEEIAGNAGISPKMQKEKEKVLEEISNDILLVYGIDKSSGVFAEDSFDNSLTHKIILSNNESHLLEGNTAS